MIDSRLSSLRKEMSALNIDAIIVPSNDPHQSEYPPKYWEIRSWISGFTGSAGIVVVSKNESGLWTDSRYFIQAEKQLQGTEITLHKVIDRSSPGYTDWICESLANGDTLGLISELISLQQYNSLKEKLNAKGIKLKLVQDPFKNIWKDRPALPDVPIFEHALSFAGRSRKDKIEAIRQLMKQKACDHHLVSSLDDIAWISNLRSRDVECNPVFVSYLLISRKETKLFVKPNKIDAELEQSLMADDIQIVDYEEINAYLERLPSEESIWVDQSLVNVSIYKSIGERTIINAPCPSIMMKAQKSDHECQQIRNCMVKDGVALCKAFYWLENILRERNVSEYEFAMKISECRKQQAHYYGESFHAIVGYRSNGAIIHYRPDPKDCLQIENSGILLVDCGAQYMDGTTDITRTISLDKPSQEQKTNYTLVLKGHIALAMSKFPIGTTGTQLDIKARQFLWDHGKNYSHGTGHGVGFFNSVHENPQGIDPSNKGRGRISQAIGMISSNEPGFYLEGAYGIRIENLILCKGSDHASYLDFETISLFPMDQSLIDKDLLSFTEKTWLNEYHETVFEKLSPQLDDNLKNWLSYKCQKI